MSTLLKKRLLMFAAVCLLGVVNLYAGTPDDDGLKQGEMKVTLTHSDVNLRWEPSLNADIYSWTQGGHVHYKKGTSFPYAGETRNGFYSIVCDGYTLWVSSNYSKLSYYADAPATNNSKKQVVVNGTNVNFRTGPSLKSPILTDASGKHIHVKKGTRLPYLGESGDFYKANYNGTMIYISKNYSYLE